MKSRKLLLVSIVISILLSTRLQNAQAESTDGANDLSTVVLPGLSNKYREMLGSKAVLVMLRDDKGSDLLVLAAKDPEIVGHKYKKKTTISRDACSVRYEPLDSGGKAFELSSHAQEIEITDAAERNRLLNLADKFIAQRDLQLYLADLQRRIKRAWFPKGDEFRQKRAVVVGKIHRTGEVSNLRLERSSGDNRSDQADLKAVANAAPFRPLPSHCPDQADVQFVFDSGPVCKLQVNFSSPSKQ